MSNPTLTAYSTTDDGLVRNNGSSAWATLRAATDGTAAYNAQSIAASLCYADGTTADKYIDRSFYYLDLTAIPAGADVVSASFSVYVTSASSGAGGSVYVVEGTQATPLTTADFDACGSTAFVDTPTNFASLTAGAYNTFTLNAAGRAYIKSKFGSIAKLCLRSSFDLNNTAPGTTVWSSMNGYFADRTGTTEDPKLVVVYSTDRAAGDTLTLTDGPVFPAIDKPGGVHLRWAADTITLADSAPPFRRSTAEVQVWPEGSNTTLSGAHSPVGSTITVASTTGFPSSGTIWIYDQADYSQAVATYTGKTSTTFTGCSWTSVIGDLNFPDAVGVSAPDAETHFPQVVALDDPATTSTPEIVVTAKQGAGHGMLNGVLVMKRTTDGGQTWSAQTTIQTAVGAGLSPRRGIFGHTLLRLKNGRLLVMWYEHNLGYATTPGSTGPVYNYMSYSDDRGVTWSTPALMDLNFGFSNRDGYTGFGSMLYTGSGSNSTYGDVYIPVTGNKDGITVHTSGETYRWETWLYKITDGGASGAVTKVAEVMKYADTGLAVGEADLVIAENGDWIMHARAEPVTGGSAEDRDRWQARSTNTGVTWGTPVKVIDGFANGAVLVKLPGGTLISTGSPVLGGDANYGQTGSVPSHDNGTTWIRALKWEATNGTYSVYNGSNYEVIINDPGTQVNTVFTYSQERGNQAGARTMFRWYVDPIHRGADTLALTDGAVRAAQAFTRTAGDSLTFTDSAAKVVTPIIRTAGDSLALTDTAVRAAVTYTRPAGDTLTLTDTATASSGGTGSLTTVTHDTYTIAGTGGPTVTSTGNQITVAEISDTSPLPA